MGSLSRAERAGVLGAEAAPSAADSAMERYAQGDDSAFGDVYDALAPRLERYFRRHTRSSSLVEDLVQQTLLHIHRARGSFILGAEVLPWAFAIARRLLIDSLRRGNREVLLSADESHARTEALVTSEAGGDQVYQARQLAERVEQVLRGLPEGQRLAYELVKHDGLSMAQAAEVLGISVGAVKVRAHRAYEALREAIHDMGEIELGGGN